MVLYHHMSWPKRDCQDMVYGVNMDHGVTNVVLVRLSVELGHECPNPKECLVTIQRWMTSCSFAANNIFSDI
jgi:hypothetical protein